MINTSEGLVFSFSSNLTVSDPIGKGVKFNLAIKQVMLGCW